MSVNPDTLILELSVISGAEIRTWATTVIAGAIAGARCGARSATVARGAYAMLALRAMSLEVSIASLAALIAVSIPTIVRAKAVVITITVEIELNLHLIRATTIIRLSDICRCIAHRHHRQRKEQKHNLLHSCNFLGLYLLFAITKVQP